MRAKEFRNLERLLKVLGSRRRLAILSALRSHGSMTVSDLAHAIDLSIFATSQHLRILKSAEIVEDSRRGFHISYRLSLVQAPIVSQVLRSL